MLYELLIVAEGPARGRIVAAQPAPAAWGAKEGPPRFAVRAVELADGDAVIGGCWDFDAQRAVPATAAAASPAQLPLPARDPPDAPAGIVTGACEWHWPCLGAIAIAAYRQNLGFAVADHGLAAWQREELTRIGVRWIEHERPMWIRRDQRPGVVADNNVWWKPWVCARAPFGANIWVDADAVITGDLAPLVRILRHAPCVSTQRLFVRDSRPLYQQIVAYLFGRATVDGLLSALAALNTGVVGFARGEPLIEEWQQASEQILSDPGAIPHCTVRDQTAFLVAVLRRAVERRPLPLLLEDEWNWPADGLSSKEVARRRSVCLDPEGMLRQAKERHPSAAVVHWLGRMKPWQIASAEDGYANH